MLTGQVTGLTGCKNEKAELINEAAKIGVPVAVYDAFVQRNQLSVARQAAFSRIGKNIWEGRFSQNGAAVSELFTESGTFITESGRLVSGTAFPEVSQAYLRTNYPVYNVKQVYVGDTPQSTSGFRALVVAWDNSSVRMVRFDNTGRFIREDIIA
ncbi:hypothetical protein GCM10023187_08530 [Nibrella viscosa]|uniref:Uncharacterized protein n=1 Tax=Nibrella viscosa TaxID=1084524 RepID=A0ABP8JYY2_9BACT